MFYITTMEENFKMNILLTYTSNSFKRTLRWLWTYTINSLRPRQNGRHFADDAFKRIFMNENVWISIRISLKFVPKGPINNILALVQIMAWRRPGDKPLSEPVMVNLLTHICVTRPQWGSLRPRDAYMRQQARLSLIQIMDCRLTGAKPLSKRCWNILNCTLGNKFQLNFNQNIRIFIQEKPFENVCKISSIFSRPQYVLNLRISRSVCCSNSQPRRTYNLQPIK